MVHAYPVPLASPRPPATPYFLGHSAPRISTVPSIVKSWKRVAINRRHRFFTWAVQLLVICNIPLATARSGLRPVLHITSGSIATISSVAIIPTRTTAEAPLWSWTAAYLLWALTNCAYACLQWLDIPVKYQRLYMLSVILLAGHFTIALSQSINSISDAATIYGPFVLTICEFTMALFYNARHAAAQSSQGEAPILGTVDTASIITTVIGV